MVWLDDFIRPRNSKSSFDVENDSESLGGVGHSTFNDDDDEDYDLEAGSQQADDSYDMSPAITNDFAINDSAYQPKTNIQQVIKNPKPLKRKHGETKESDLEKEKISFLKTINQRMEARDKNQKSEDAEDRYVATIADKLRELPYRERLMAKHEIENTLYKFQMQALEKENVYTMQASSANNMGHNFPLLQFPMTVPSPQIHHNSRQQNNFTGNNQANQPLSPSFPTAPMPSPSYPPFNVPQDGERN